MQKRNISKPRKISDGIKAERIAERFLCRHGYRLIERNFHSRVGEVDLIMRWQDVYVFVEVRYRATTSRGNASESITPSKYQRCLKTAQYWLMKNKLLNSQYQIDVIAIDGSLMIHNITWLQAV